MSIVNWNDAYSVDIQEIDEQHKRLIDIMNELYAALASTSSRSHIGAILDKLMEYTKVHFAVEETLMRIFDYEGYHEHKAIHDHIVTRVVDFQRKFREGDDKVGMELLMFLKEWLFHHINDQDKKYVSTLHKAGVKKTWLRKFW